MCRAKSHNGGSRCLDHRALRRLSVEEMRPAGGGEVPEAEWGTQPSAEDLYSRYDSAVAGATLELLQRLSAVEPQVTRELVGAIPADARAHGLAYRMKSPASLAAKISTKARASSTRSPHEISQGLGDVLRYTVLASGADRLAPTAAQTLESLAGSGWQLRELEQSYADGNPYKGVHALLRHPAADQDVEVQFHTPESIQVKERYHRDYEVMRDPDRPAAERSSAFELMAREWAKVPAPRGVADLVVSGIRVELKTYRNKARPAAAALADDDPESERART